MRDVNRIIAILSINAIILKSGNRVVPLATKGCGLKLQSVAIQHNKIVTFIAVNARKRIAEDHIVPFTPGNFARDV